MERTEHNDSIQNECSEGFLVCWEVLFLSEINYYQENTFIGAVFTNSFYWQCSQLMFYSSKFLPRDTTLENSALYCSYLCFTTGH
jgi:hypothetical protein